MWTPPPFMGPRLRTLSLFGSAQAGYVGDGDTDTVTMPAGIRKGDLCFFFEQRASGSTPADVVPTGFTKIGTGLSGSAQLRTTYSYKILDGTETTFPQDNTPPALVYSHRIAAVFRGDVPVRRVDSAGGFQFQAVAVNPSAQTQTVASLQSPVIVFGTFVTGTSSGVVDPRTMTPTKTGEINHTTWTGSSTAMYLGYLIFNYGTTPSNTTIDMDDEGSANYLGSCYMQVS